MEQTGLTVTCVRLLASLTTITTPQLRAWMEVSQSQFAIVHRYVRLVQRMTTVQPSHHVQNVLVVYIPPEALTPSHSLHPSVSLAWQECLRPREVHLQTARHVAQVWPILMENPGRNVLCVSSENLLLMQSIKPLSDHKQRRA